MAVQTQAPSSSERAAEATATTVPSEFSHPSAPLQSPLPARPGSSEQAPREESGQPSRSDSRSRLAARPLPPGKARRPKATYRLHLDNLEHWGTASFFSAVEYPQNLLSDGTAAVLDVLYPASSETASDAEEADPAPVPPVRSITLVVREMDGVAYTTGIRLDPECHKEIHLSTEYIVAVVMTPDLEREIKGIVVHELVHCWQYNGLGTAPGGLIEGIADFVRLRAGFGKPEWARHRNRNWDGGYDTTALFLDWLDYERDASSGQVDSNVVKHRKGKGLVVKMNGYLQAKKYVEKEFWPELCGSPVAKLWKEYEAWIESKDLWDEPLGDNV